MAVYCIGMLTLCHVCVYFQICLGMIFPPFLLFGLEILNLGETQLSAFQKMGVFYSSPLSKFAHGMVSNSYFSDFLQDKKLKQ